MKEETKKRKKKIPSNYYIDPEEFKTEIIKSLKQDNLTPRAIEMLMLLVEKLGNSSKLQYKYPEDREDCKSFAIFDILRYWRGFDPNISNYPFSYYTQMAINGLAKGLKKLRPKGETQMISLSNENIFNF